jgi:hypothetical protein
MTTARRPGSRCAIRIATFLFAAICAIAKDSTVSRADPTGPVDPAGLARTRLERHVDAGALLAWRDTCTAAEAQALDFLFAWLPSSDLAAWRAGAVTTDIRLALLTRAAAPWRESIDDETFLRFVLPHRAA